MKKIIALALVAVLGGCVVAPAPYYTDTYYVGYYNPGYGYWNGYGWDSNFYYYGHPGYRHYYHEPHGYHHHEHH